MEHDNMLDADRPILTKEQDRLGRAEFAKSLARSIVDHTNVESLVIGLYGGWGTGKTSIINLTLEELRYASSNMFDEERPILLNFSPWSYSGQNELIYSFFRRLSSEMRAAVYFENSDKIISLLELYISFFTHKPIPKAYRLPYSWFTKMFRRKKIKEESFGWESGRDLTMVKAELNQLLSKQKHKLIIFIDNIARLKDDEIIQIFQMIKSIGDFANTIYILAMDKDYMVKVVNHLRWNEGADYVGKLVQLPFEVPPISKQDIESLLLDRLQHVIDIVPENKWDADYWADMYYSTIKFFFENCRDITRYVNTLSFSYVFVKDLVNPVDFFAIIALQVFEPQVFNGVRENKDLFADLAEHVLSFDKAKIAEDKTRCDEILNRSIKTPRAILLRLLIRLFPRLRGIYQSDLSFFHSEAVARKNKRICTFDLFDIYFRFTIASDSFSEAEMQAVIDSAHDEKGFAMALLRLNQDDRVLKFLDIMDSHGAFSVEKNNIEHVITALLDSGDLFPAGISSKLRLNTAMRIHRILHQLLRRYENNDERFHVFKKAVEKIVNSIYTTVHELNEQSRQHNEQEDTYLPAEQRDFTYEQLQELKKIAVEKIMVWTDSDRLIEHPQLIPILYAWKSWGSEEACKQYVASTIKNDRGLISFLCAALKIPIAEAANKEEKNPEWKSYLQNVENFVPLDVITPRAEELFRDNYFEKLRETEQLALMIFLDLVKPGTVKVIPKTTV